MDDNALNLADVTLAVLAGGKGSRMGMPKSQLRISDQPLLSWLLDRWRWPGPTMLITAPGNERPPGCERFSSEAVDASADEGPMRGVVTALQHATTPQLILTPCDMPLMDRSHFAALVEKLGVDGLAAVFDREPIDPFPIVLRIDARQTVIHAFAAGERSMSNFVKRHPLVRRAKAPPSIAWTNLNRPDELETFVASLREF